MIIEKSKGIFGNNIWIVSYKGIEVFNYDLSVAIAQCYKAINNYNII